MGKKYQIIYADPPWSFKNYDKKKTARWVGNKYSVMKLNNIVDLPINKISDTNCVLFLWVTMPKLNECFEVINSWGFTYKTCGFTWVKRNKIASTYFWGMGRWTRSNPELCLICTKGNPQRVSASVHSIVDEKIRQHSQKPLIVKQKIVQLCGNLPRIELFSREHTPGWDVIEGHDGADGTGNDILEWINKNYD